MKMQIICDTSWPPGQRFEQSIVLNDYFLVDSTVLLLERWLGNLICWGEKEVYYHKLIDLICLRAHNNPKIFF